MTDDFFTIYVGQTGIEKDQIRPNRLNSPQSLFPVADLINGVACWRQYDIESQSGSTLRCQQEALVDPAFPSIMSFGNRLQLSFEEELDDPAS